MNIDQGNMLDAVRVRTNEKDIESGEKHVGIVLEDAPGEGAGKETGPENVEVQDADNDDGPKDGLSVPGLSRGRLIAIIITATGSAFLNVSLCTFLIQSLRGNQVFCGLYTCHPNAYSDFGRSIERYHTPFHR